MQAEIARPVGPVGQGIGVVIAVGRALLGDGWRGRPSSVGAKQGLRKYGVAGQRQGGATHGKAWSALLPSNGSGG